jgi:hypothetical protein
MSKKRNSTSITTIIKWILFSVLALFGLKILLGVISALTVGMALASLVMWGLGALALGGGVLFLGIKLLSGKKKK